MDKQKPIVFFDGVCNFCSYWVNFAIKRDRNKRLLFSPLQGETAKEILKRFNLDPKATDSVILVQKEKAYTQSSAAFRIYKYLDGGWKWFYVFIVVPKFIRDFFYDIIARNRYKWFGKKKKCMVPDKDILERFLP